jgi:DNA-directed RNA polymerase subunit M/transcription elongation factor TFIIS
VLLDRRPETSLPRYYRPFILPAARASGRILSGDDMAKIAKTADRKKVMDTTKSTDCPKCGKPTRIVKRVKDRERGVPGGIFISCSACEFCEKL